MNLAINQLEYIFQCYLNSFKHIFPIKKQNLTVNQTRLCLINSQTLKMISQVESFLCPDKQGTPEEGRRIQQPKHCVTTNDNKDEENSPKNHTQNIRYIRSITDIEHYL